MITRTPVLIVGGGPVGMATALVLGHHDVPSIVCEKFPSINPHPRAHVVNTRSMELFRSWGIADAVIADSIDPSWLTSFTWRTTLAGEELGRVDLTTLPEADLVRRILASPVGAQSCAQDRVQHHLTQAVIDQGVAELRQPAEAVTLVQHDGGVTATIEHDGASHTIEADYVVGADGAAGWSRRQVGIAMRGMPPLGQQINIYFHADLSPYLGPHPSVLYWVINSRARGVFIAMDGEHRWTFNIEYNPALETVQDYTPERCVQLLRAAIGDDVAIEIQSVGTWTMTAETAQNYRSGRVFLAGDAAHRFPPTGGLGMNTGLVDADNLAWKLAGVINGWASPTILDTYNDERKPVALANGQQSVTNALTMAGTGIGPNGGQVAANLESSDSEIAGAERARLTGEIDRQLTHFDALNLDLGYRYPTGSIVVDDGTDPYAPADAARDFRPDAQPGARLPHGELVVDGASVSTLDLVGPHLLVLVGPKGSDWLASIDEVDAPTAVVMIGRDAHDPSGNYLEAVGVGLDGCLVARPDGHVAFRATALADDAPAALISALARATGHS